MEYLLVTKRAIHSASIFVEHVFKTKICIIKCVSYKQRWKPKEQYRRDKSISIECEQENIIS